MAVSLAEITPSFVCEQFDPSQYNMSSFESEFSDSCPSNPSNYDDFQTPLATGQLPSRDEFEGPYGFSIVLDTSKTSTSKGSWDYSLQMNKLFVKMSCSVPIQFRVSQNEDIQGMRVRAVLVFDVPDSYTDPVKRCPLHTQAEHKANQGYEHLQHVVRCCHRDAVYEVDAQSGRHSVSVPLGSPQPGSSCVTLLYSMMCKSSCEGGMNRRNTSIVFTLEKNFQVLGRHVVKVRVCSCPKRDMGNELNQRNVNNNAEGVPKGKKRKTIDKVVAVKPEVKEEPQRFVELQPVQRNSEPFLYLEVRSKKHFYELTQKAQELYKARVAHNLAMYENLLKEQV